MSPVTIKNNRVHIITTEAHRKPRRRKVKSAYVGMPKYIRELNLYMKIATEGPETAYTEKKTVYVGLSD